MTNPPVLPSNQRVTPLNDLIVAMGQEKWLRSNRLDSLDALFGVSGESLNKPGLDLWRERLRLTLDVDGESRHFYLKRFSNPPGAARRLIRRSGTGASSMAGVEWEWMRRLAEDGIPCVRPVAFGQELDRSKELRSALLTEAVPGASLEHWSTTWGEPDRATIRNLIEPLANLVGRLHQMGYAHRDLYLSHIFFDPTADLHSSLHLIDLQRITCSRRSRYRWLIKDVAALNFSTPQRLVSPTDRLRWLTHYLRAAKLKVSVKRFVYRVVGKTQGIAAHDRRRIIRLG